MLRIRNCSFHRNEISRVLLLLLLELPPARLVESHTSLLGKFATIPHDRQYAEELGLPIEIFLCLSELVLACRKKKLPETEESLDRMFQFKSLDTEHYWLLEELTKKCNQ